MVYKFINKNYIFSRLGQLRSFWKLRHKLGWLEFQRQKTNYTIQDSISAVWTIS